MCRKIGERVFARRNYGRGKIATTTHVDNRSNKCDCSVTQFSDIQFTPTKLDDKKCRILRDPTSDVTDCSRPGARMLVITRMKFERFKKQSLLIIQFHNTAFPYKIHLCVEIAGSAGLTQMFTIFLARTNFTFSHTMNCSITYNFVDHVFHEANTIKPFIMDVIQRYVNGRESSFME